MIEAYTARYDKENFRAPIPKGYDTHEVMLRREAEVRDNILRYLGEYRLGVKFDEFFYKEDKSESGNTFLSSDRRDPGPILNIFRKAIFERERKGLPVRREVAECLGFQRLEEALGKSPDGTLFVWVSPPGPSEEGYGLYSFTFIGQSQRDEEGRRSIRVIPYRNILTKEEHRSYLRYFFEDAEKYQKDTDFLSNPVVFSKNEFVQRPEDILILIGEKERFNTDWQSKLKKKIGHLVDGYIDLAKKGASDEELTQARNAIENYTIAIKGNMESESSDYEMKSVSKIFEEWGGWIPPKAGGSCGASTLMELHKEKNWEYHTGICMACNSEGVDVGPCNICRSCEKKFDQEGSVPQAA